MANRYNFEKLLKDINKEFNKNITAEGKERKIILNFIKNYTYPKCDQLAYNIHMRYYKEGQSIQEIKESIENKCLIEQDITSAINIVNSNLCQNIEEIIKRMKENKQDEFIRFQCLYLGQNSKLNLLNQIGIYTKRDLINFINENFKIDAKTTLINNIKDFDDIDYAKLNRAYNEEYNSTIQESYDDIYGKNKMDNTNNNINNITDQELINLIVNRFGLDEEEIINAIENNKKNKIINTLNEISKPINISNWTNASTNDKQPSFLALKNNTMEIHLDVDEKDKNNWKIWFKYRDEENIKENKSQYFDLKSLKVYKQIVEFMNNKEV